MKCSTIVMPNQQNNKSHHIKPTTSQKNNGIAKTAFRSKATEGPITIIGNSMIKMIKPTKLSQLIGEKVNIKTLPGATIDDMNHYMQPTLKKTAEACGPICSN